MVVKIVRVTRPLTKPRVPNIDVAILCKNPKTYKNIKLIFLSKLKMFGNSRPNPIVECTENTSIVSIKTTQPLGMKFHAKLYNLDDGFYY